MWKEPEPFYRNILHHGSLTCELSFDFTLHIRTDNSWNWCTWFNLKKTHYAHHDSDFSLFCSQPFYHVWLCRLSLEGWSWKFIDEQYLAFECTLRNTSMDSGFELFLDEKHLWIYPWAHIQDKNPSSTIPFPLMRGKSSHFYACSHELYDLCTWGWG